MISLKELLREHEGMCNNARDLVTQRGKEYAPDDDTLKTFRISAVLDNRKPSQVCFSMMCIKFARIHESMQKGEIHRDSYLDLVNYVIYLHTLLLDEELEKRCSTKE